MNTKNLNNYYSIYNIVRFKINSKIKEILFLFLKLPEIHFTFTNYKYR